MALTRLAVAAQLAVLLTAGCSGGATPPARSATPQPSPSATVAPRLGGPSVAPARVPRRPMTRLERPIAARLAHEAAAEGLGLDYLRCPPWDGRMPHRLRCTGWFDGVRAPVLVRLTTLAGGSLGFDARIGPGVVATANLVEELRTHGYTHVDCGDRPAYPSRVGLRLVCGVTEHGTRRYVVATVGSRSGAVSIRDYRTR